MPGRSYPHTCGADYTDTESPHARSGRAACGPGEELEWSSESHDCRTPFFSGHTPKCYDFRSSEALPLSTSKRCGRDSPTMASLPCRLVASAMTLANLVGVECSASCTCRATYQSAFLSACEGPDAGTARGCSGYRQLISVLLPETAAMTVAAIAPLPRRARHRESQNHEHQNYDKKLFQCCSSNLNT